MALSPTSSRGETFAGSAAGGQLGGTYPNPTVDMDILTTKGDLLSQSADGVYVRVPVGTGTQVLGVTSGVPAYVAAAAGVTLLNYTEKTSASPVTGGSEGAASTVLTASAGVVVDGSTLICVTFYAPTASIAASQSLLVLLYDDTGAAVLGNIWVATEGTAPVSLPIFAQRYFTPAAGTRTYSIRAWRSAGTSSIAASTGGPGEYMPMFIRITKGA